MSKMSDWSDKIKFENGVIIDGLTKGNYRLQNENATFLSEIEVINSQLTFQNYTLNEDKLTKECIQPSISLNVD